MASPSTRAASAPHAILLAAGMGSRLDPELDGKAKPMLEVGGRSLLVRALHRLDEVGVGGLTVAVGHRASSIVEALGRIRPEARVVVNPDPAGTGSMRSLALAGRAALAEASFAEALVLEADVIFEARALPALLGAPPADATILVSGPTGAGDEVWVCGHEGRVSEIAKRPASDAPRLGELVGLTRLTRGMLEAMIAAHETAGDDAVREDYEARISRMAPTHAVHAHRVEDLVWGEIDDAGHLRRVLERVLPALERGGGSS